MLSLLKELKNKTVNLIFEDNSNTQNNIEYYPTIYKIGKIGRGKNWWEFSNFLKGLNAPLVIYRNEETLEYGWGYLNSITELKKNIKTHSTAIGGLTLKPNPVSQPISGNNWWKGSESLALLFGIHEGTRNFQPLKEITLPNWSGYIIIDPLTQEEQEKLLKKLEKSVEITSRLSKEGYRHQSEIGIDTLKQVQKIKTSAENTQLIKSTIYHAIKNSGKGFKVYIYGDFSTVPGLEKTNKPEPNYLDPTTLAFLTHPPEYVDKLPNPTFRIPSGIENGEIHIGYLWQKGCAYNQKHNEKKVYLQMKHISRHMGIFGKTGSGKTNALEYMVYQMQKLNKYHIVILDKEGQYCGWKDKDGVIGDFEVIDPYYDIHYQINLFDVFFDAGQEEIAFIDKLKKTKIGQSLATSDTLDIPIETFIAIYKTLSVVTGDEVGSTQIGILRAMYRAWLNYIYESNKQNFVDTPEVIAKRELLKTNGIQSFINFAKKAPIDQILNGKAGFNIIDAYTKVINKLEELKSKAPFLCADKTTIDIETLMNTNFILNLFNLYNKTNSLFAMGMVAYAYMSLIWNYHREHPPESGTKPTILIIDEVQNYAPSDVGMLKAGIKKLLLATIMEEGRKWGVWAICAGPTLVGLDDAIRRQPGSYLFFQFTEEDEKMAVYSLLGDKKMQEEFDIGELPVGHCIARILTTDESGGTYTSPPFGITVPYAEPLLDRKPHPYHERELRTYLPTTILKEEYLEDFNQAFNEAIEATSSDEYKIKLPPKVDLITKTVYNELGNIEDNITWIDGIVPIILKDNEPPTLIINKSINPEIIQRYLLSEEFISNHGEPTEINIYLEKGLFDSMITSIREAFKTITINKLVNAEIIGDYEPPEHIKDTWLSNIKSQKTTPKPPTNNEDGKEDSDTNQTKTQHKIKMPDDDNKNNESKLKGLINRNLLKKMKKD